MSWIGKAVWVTIRGPLEIGLEGNPNKMIVADGSTICVAGRVTHESDGQVTAYLVGIDMTEHLGTKHKSGPAYPVVSRITVEDLAERLPDQP